MLRDSFVPEAWKLSVVIPLYKGKGDTGTVTSYRPVAITNLLCRVLESVVLRRLLHHLRSLPSGGFHLHQGGFREGYTTDMTLSHIVSSLVESGRHDGACYVRDRRPDGRPISSRRRFSRLLIAVDFKDAFCRVSPESVELSLRKREVPDYICRWIRSFLTQRKMRVWVGGRMSRAATLDGGCPQGSILGPILWCLVMDDLLHRLDTICASLREQRFFIAPAQGEPATHGRLRDLLGRLTLQHRDGTRSRWDLDHEFVSFHPLCADFAAYADDLTVWVAGSRPQLAVAAAQLLLQEISAWAAAHGIAVSTKTAARWITQVSSRDSFPREFVCLQAAEGLELLIPPTWEPEATPLRILGLHIDPALSFLEHSVQVAERVGEVLETCQVHQPYMASSLRRIILVATAQSLVLYALPVYWDCCSAEAKKKLRQCWGDICLTIVGGVFTTSRIAAVWASGSYPLETMKEHARLRLIRRIWSLGEEVAGLFLQAPPLAPLAYGPKPSFRDSLPTPPPLYQLRQSPRLTSCPFQALMGALQKSRFHTTLSLDGKALRKKGKAPKRHKRFNLQQLSATTAPLEVWTDGSVEPGEKSGGAYVIVQNNEKVMEGHTSLGRYACSYSMERAALRLAMESLVTFCSTTPTTYPSIRVVTDSLSVLQELQQGPLHQQEEEMEDIWALAAQLPTNRIDWVFLFSHLHEDPSLAPQHRPPLASFRDHPEYFNMYVDHAAASAATATPTQALWLQDFHRPQHQALNEEATTNLDDKSKDTLQYRVMNEVWPRHVIGFRGCGAGQKFVLQMSMSACSRIPGSLQTKPEHCIHCNALIGRHSDAVQNSQVEEAALHVFNCPKVRPPPGITVRSLFEDPPTRELVDFLFQFARLEERERQDEDDNEAEESEEDEESEDDM